MKTRKPIEELKNPNDYPCISFRGDKDDLALLREFHKNSDMTYKEMVKIWLKALYEIN